MPIQKNISIDGAGGRPVLLDVHYPDGGRHLPVIIFAHGFKGFKDWGHWQRIGERVVHAGFAFIKFNFSHNGTTPDNPAEFGDLEAFGENNYGKELADLDAVLDGLSNGYGHLSADLFDLDRVALVGHSRGGAISIIKASGDNRICALATWAAVSHLDYAWPSEDFIKQWKENGRYFVTNSRTGQEMPIHWQLYEDFDRHRDQYDVQAALGQFKKPYLILHGDADESVPVASARQLHAWCPHSELCIIEGADHVFGGAHPFQKNELPSVSENLVNQMLAFLRKQWEM